MNLSVFLMVNPNVTFPLGNKEVAFSQLNNLSIKDLDRMYIQLQDELEKLQPSKNGLLKSKASVDEVKANTLNYKLELVKKLFNYKTELKELVAIRQQAAQDKADTNAAIREAIIAKKKEELSKSLEGKSVEELQQMLK